MQLFRIDTYTGLATGYTVDLAGWAVNYFALQVKGSGAVPTLWNVLKV